MQCCAKSEEEKLNAVRRGGADGVVCSAVPAKNGKSAAMVAVDVAEEGIVSDVFFCRASCSMVVWHYCLQSFGVLGRVAM